MHTKPWINSPPDNRLYEAEILWRGDFDAVLIAEEGQAPDCYWYGVSCATRSGKRTKRVPIVAMQHGYAQDWGRLKSALNADYFLIWGLYAIDRVQADPRFILTGNPRFDSYDIKDANCCYGYTLAMAWPGDICNERLATLPLADSPIRLMRHPDDTSTSGVFNYEIWSGQEQSTQQLICYADAVITRPSTCALEAAIYGKAVIPWNWNSNHPVPTQKNLDFLLQRGDSTRRVANFMEGVAQEWQSK